MSKYPPESGSAQLPLEAEGMPVPTEQRFDLNQRRAFGSVPGLLGRQLDVPKFEALDGTAVQRVNPATIEGGLLGREGGYAVDSIVLSSEEFTTIVRNPGSFKTAVQATTNNANRDINSELRRQEKLVKSGKGSFEGKITRQATCLESLVEERTKLEQLAEWQRTPGYSRTTQADMVLTANQAWNLTFRGMLKTLQDQHGLSDKEHHDMTQAMAYKLFRGSQRDKVQYWGQMLHVAIRYNRAKTVLFTNRQREIARQSGHMAVELEDLYKKHGVTG